MKNIDDMMIEKALSNLKKMRRFKPWLVVMGIMMLTLAGFIGYFLYLFAQRIVPENIKGRDIIALSMYTISVVFYVCLGMFMLCSGLVRNNKDIIIEHLAGQYLKDKKDSSKDEI
jgi:hypothetical protein